MRSDSFYFFLHFLSFSPVALKMVLSPPRPVYLAATSCIGGIEIRAAQCVELNDSVQQPSDRL